MKGFASTSFTARARRGRIWPRSAPLRERLMRQQFCGQNASYRANYPGACFEIVEHDGAPIGRIVTARTPDAVLSSTSRSLCLGAGAGSAPAS